MPDFEDLIKGMHKKWSKMFKAFTENANDALHDDPEASATWSEKADLAMAVIDDLEQLLEGMPVEEDIMGS